MHPQHDVDMTSSNDNPCSSSPQQQEVSRIDSLDKEASGGLEAKRQALVNTDCNEVANFVGYRSLTAECKYNLLVNHFKPGADYSFPKGSSKRAFQYRWLMNFPWLVYSKQENGGFCLPCVLFASYEYRKPSFDYIYKGTRIAP